MWPPMLHVFGCRSNQCAIDNEACAANAEKSESHAGLKRARGYAGKRKVMLTVELNINRQNNYNLKLFC